MPLYLIGALVLSAFAWVVTELFTAPFSWMLWGGAIALYHVIAGVVLLGTSMASTGRGAPPGWLQFLLCPLPTAALMLYAGLYRLRAKLRKKEVRRTR